MSYFNPWHLYLCIVSYHHDQHNTTIPHEYYILHEIQVASGSLVYKLKVVPTVYHWHFVSENQERALSKICSKKIRYPLRNRLWLTSHLWKKARNGRFADDPEEPSTKWCLLSDLIFTYKVLAIPHMWNSKLQGGTSAPWPLCHYCCSSTLPAKNHLGCALRFHAYNWQHLLCRVLHTCLIYMRNWQFCVVLRLLLHHCSEADTALFIPSYYTGTVAHLFCINNT